MKSHNGRYIYKKNTRFISSRCFFDFHYKFNHNAGRIPPLLLSTMLLPLTSIKPLLLMLAARLFPLPGERTHHHLLLPSKVAVRSELYASFIGELLRVFNCPESPKYLTTSSKLNRNSRSFVAFPPGVSCHSLSLFSILAWKIRLFSSAEKVSS